MLSDIDEDLGKIDEVMMLGQTQPQVIVLACGNCSRYPPTFLTARVRIITVGWARQLPERSASPMARGARGRTIAPRLLP